MRVNSMTAPDRFGLLIDRGVLSAMQLLAAREESAARGVELEKILVMEYGVSRRILLQTLSEWYNCAAVEYDERLPVPPEIITGLDGERLSISHWFPIIKDGNTVIIAANNPEDPVVLSEVKKLISAERYEFRVALEEDIQWFIQDFLHSKPGRLIGTERTGLAFWRNTMAQWRTRLACYRNDLASVRTKLSVLRWGLALIALSDVLMRTQKAVHIFYLNWVMVAAGLSFAVFGLAGYRKIRSSRIKPPRPQTLVEVTSASLNFLEDYHYIENAGEYLTIKQTMLARLGDFLADHCTILYPSPASRERTHLARERNVLAGQRTVAACYRTIYARARTGLAFIRTGVAFLSLGLGLIQYFGFGIQSALESLIVVAGLLMVVDGVLWYLPVRKEQAETPRCPVPP